MLFLLVLCECGTGEGGGDGRNFAAGYGRPVRVSAAAGIPGCFVVGGERYGYFCELMEAYAENGGRELDFTAGVSSARMWNNLRSGLTDVGVAVSPDVEAGALSLPVRTTTYVMLAGRERPCGGTGLSGTVGSGRVVMPEGFTRTASYAGLLDSLAGAQLYISPLNVYELAAGLARGESDFLICEQGEAAVVGEFVPGLATVYEFAERVDISMVFSPENPALYYDFVRWFGGYSRTEEYAALCDVYSGRGDGRCFGGAEGDRRVPNGISVWDGMIREVGMREGVDWRLLSAIAYKESRFRHNVVSPSGACGLMQIMPVTARHFKIDQRRLSDPEVNITLAAKLIKSIDESLGFAEGTPDESRLSIILAAYNCGIGTVRDARRLARAEGENPDSWEAVSRCLALMGDGDYMCDSVTYRRFSGYGETLAFVDGVKQKYYTYRKVVE